MQEAPRQLPPPILSLPKRERREIKARSRSSLPRKWSRDQDPMSLQGEERVMAQLAKILQAAVPC